MTTFKAMFIAAGTTLALSGAAFANVTVVNQTDQTHTVTFDKGQDEVKHEVEANGTVSEPCPDGCGVRFSGHDRMSVDGEKLAITEGSTRPVLMTE